MTATTPAGLSSTTQVFDPDARTYRITLANSERLNALTSGMYAEVRQGILHAYADERVDAIVLEGDGSAFATGGDLDHFLELTEAGGPEAMVRADEAYAQSPFRAALRCPKPIVAAVDGYCLAGGLILAMCSDVVIATRRSTFAVPEAKVGVYDPFVPELLPLVVGMSRARDMTQTGASIDAETAERWGLVTRLVDGPDELAEAVELALTQLRRASPTARAMYKRAITARVPDTDLVENFRIAMGHNGREGLRAFVEKRDPVWEPLRVDGVM